MLRENSNTLLFDLMALLDQCIDNNRRSGITGVLAYRNSAFLQVIEGPEAAVDALYERIRRDWRHRDACLILREKCERRSFAEWSMAYLGYDHDLRMQFDRASGQLTPAAAEELVDSMARILV